MNDKYEYIIKQLSRARKKRFEHYVVQRIWHLLNDLEIKFVTQQYVIRPEGGRALTDMYFPQFGLHIEVDEPYHLNQLEEDWLREADITNATGHAIERVNTSEGIVALNNRIDEIVQLLRERKGDKGFIPWNMEEEQNPERYIRRGYIDINDDVAFKYSYLACNCFGYAYEGFQRGGTRHPHEPNTLIWFPKLYRNQDWNNTISDDDMLITEISNNQDLLEEHIESQITGVYHNRIIFARVKDPLGGIMYRFKGKYELDTEVSSVENGLIWRRVAIRVNTYVVNDMG